VPRIYSTQLGDAPTGVTSGVAINSLTEAGAVAMGELNDNYRFGRRRVHEQLLDMIFEDHMAEELPVIMGSGQSKRTITLNTWSPEGAPLNRVEDAPVSVGLSDIPTSPAFRMQEQMQLATMIQAMQGNPAALNLLGAAYIENSALTNRQQIADDFRRSTGQAVSGDRQAAAEAQQKNDQRMAEQEQMQKAAATIGMEKEAALIEKTKSETELNNSRATQIGFEMGFKHADAVRPQAANDPQAAQEAEKTRLIDEAMVEAKGEQVSA
jgi:hypothetical protein